MTHQPSPSRIASTLLFIGVHASGFAASFSLWDQWGLTPAWWNLAVLGGVATSLVLLGLGMVGRLGAAWGARVLLATVGAGLLTLPAVSEAVYTSTSVAWLAALLPTAMAASVLVTRHHVVGVGLGLAVLVCRAAFLVSDRTDADLTRVTADVVFNVTVQAASLAILLALNRAQSVLLAEAGQAAGSYAQARATEQLGRHNALWDSLIHDEVLAALETVSRAGDDTDVGSVVAAAAQHLRDGPRPAAATTEPTHLRDDLLETVLTTCPWATTDLGAPGPGAVPVPDRVVQTILLAVGEALRNASTHAYPPGRPGPVSVSLVHGPDRIQVVVSDQGRGFRRDQVPATSFGVALSIEDRMDSVGGLAVLHTAPGLGTLVELTWSPRGRR